MLLGLWCTLKTHTREVEMGVLRVWSQPRIHRKILTRGQGEGGDRKEGQTYHVKEKSKTEKQFHINGLDWFPN